MRHARKPDAAARPAAVSRRDKPSNYPGGRQSALTALERHEIGLLRSVGGHASSILQIAEQMGRTREAVRHALDSIEAREAMSAARAVMERNAENFALDWTVASQVAASEGNHKPARDALGAIGVVTPLSEERPSTAVTVVMPFTLGALAGYRPPGTVAEVGQAGLCDDAPKMVSKGG